MSRRGVPTWEDTAGATGELVDGVPALVAMRGPLGARFAAEHGAAMAQLVLDCLSLMPGPHQAAPDVRASLQRLTEQPELMRTEAVDGEVLVQMQLAGYRIFRMFTPRGPAGLEVLLPFEVRACARHALAHFRPHLGRPPRLSEAGVRMVAALMKRMSDPARWPPAQQRKVIADALLLAGLGAGEKSVEAYRTAAAKLSV